MNDYDLEYIEKLRIHELRDFAKKLGVSSPTTMKKDELIEKINSIISIDESSESTNKFVKKQNEIDFFNLLTSDNTSILNSLLGLSDKQNIDDQKKLEDKDTSNTIVMKKKQSDYNSGISFTFSLNQNECQYGQEDVYYVYGFVDIHPSGYGILREGGFLPSDNDMYFTTALIKKHNLRKGNYIQGKAKFIMEGKPRIVYEITQVEDGAKTKRLINFEDAEYNGLGNNFRTENFKLDFKRGERVYVDNMSLKNAVDLGFDLVDENDVGVKLINIKARPEENYKSHQKMQIINIPFNKTEIELVNTVELVIERIKREFEYNKANVLILYNFGELVRSFNVAYEGCLDFSKFNAKALNKISNILYLSKFFDGNYNCSLICIDKNGIASDIKTLFELEFKPLFNKLMNSVEQK